MIDLSNTKLTRIIVHRVGNPLLDEQVTCSTRELTLRGDSLIKAVKSWLFNAFDTNYEYRFADTDANKGSFQSMVEMSIHRPEDFVEGSAAMAQKLYDCSAHPKIKAGDLVIATFTDLLIGDELVDGLVLCKAETKRSFLQFDLEEDQYSIRHLQGIDVRKADKAALILEQGDGEEQRIFAFDHARADGARYWLEDFLEVRSFANDYADTRHLIDMTQSFVRTHMPASDEMDKLEEADALNRSREYFTASEQFSVDDYARQLFPDEELSRDFLHYKDDYEEQKNVSVRPEFDVSQEAVKKYGRVFRSVLKLDKNFHVYIHGDRDMIQRGTDREGRKYYKLYYEEES